MYCDNAGLAGFLGDAQTYQAIIIHLDGSRSYFPSTTPGTFQENANGSVTQIASDTNYLVSVTDPNSENGSQMMVSASSVTDPNNIVSIIDPNSENGMSVHAQMPVAQTIYQSSYVNPNSENSNSVSITVTNPFQALPPQFVQNPDGTVSQATAIVDQSVLSNTVAIPINSTVTDPLTGNVSVLQTPNQYSYSTGPQLGPQQAITAPPPPVSIPLIPAPPPNTSVAPSGQVINYYTPIGDSVPGVPDTVNKPATQAAGYGAFGILALLLIGGSLLSGKGE
jgi:hypothetical protein